MMRDVSVMEVPLCQRPCPIRRPGQKLLCQCTEIGGAALFFSPAFLRLFLYFSYTFLILFLGFKREEKEKKRQEKEKKRQEKEKKSEEKTKKRQEK